jgi:four helix bundle protein
MKENIVQEKSYSFALKIIDLYRKLSEQKEFVISNQILKSGTSIGANVEEATAGLSKRDFIAKMAISSKEARETNYWLRLLRDSELCPSVDLSELLEESEELVKMLTAIVKTSQNNMKSNF